MLFDPFNIHTQKFVFSDLESSCDSLSWGDGQVLNLFIVNLEHWGIDFVFHIFFLAGTNPVENFIESDGNNTLVGPETNHAVGLSWASLTIGKQTTMIALPSIIENILSNSIVNFLLVGIFSWGSGLHVAIRLSLKLVKGPERIVEGKVFLSLSFKGLYPGSWIFHLNDAFALEFLFSLVKRPDSYCYLNTHRYFKN